MEIKNGFFWFKSFQLFGKYIDALQDQVLSLFKWNLVLVSMLVSVHHDLMAPVLQAHSTKQSHQRAGVILIREFKTWQMCRCNDIDTCR
jgi:hypothetical protein